MLALLLALAITCSTVSERVEEAVASYIEINFSVENANYQFDFRRINWNLFPDEFDSVRVFRIGKDSPLGNTVFTLGVYNDNNLIKAVPVSIGVSLMVEALTTTEQVNAGEIFKELKMDKRLITNKGMLPIVDPAKLDGMQAKMHIPAGSMIYPAMIENVPIVKPGDNVNIIFEKGSIKITANGIARQRGGIGDIIRVVNIGSKKIIRAKIIDSTTVALK